MKRMHGIRKVLILLMKAFAVPKDYYSDFYIIKNSYLRSHINVAKFGNILHVRYMGPQIRLLFSFKSQSQSFKFWSVLKCSMLLHIHHVFHQIISKRKRQVTTFPSGLVRYLRGSRDSIECHTSVTIGRAPLDCQASVSLCSRSLSDGQIGESSNVEGAVGMLLPTCRLLLSSSRTSPKNILFMFWPNR